MDALTASVFIVFFVGVFLGIPIAYSLALGALLPMALFIPGYNMIGVVQKFFVGVDLFSFMAIPLFIFCGGLLEKSGVSRKLCTFVTSLVGWMNGGVAIVTFVACMFFGAISGSATATVLAIGSVMVPIMLSQGYDEQFSLATIAIGGILGSIIPPSIPMVVYGMNAGADIGAIFMGGVTPGVIMTFGFSVYAYIYGKKHVPPVGHFNAKEVWRTFKDAIWGLAMPLIILGGIYGGFFTPTEAAAVASVYGILVGFVIYRELNLKKFYQCMRDSAVSASMIMFIVAAASAYCYVMTRQQIPAKLTAIITSMTSSYTVFMLMVILLLMIMGCFMETCASILVVTPMLLPICNALHINLVQFGVIMVVTLAIGFVTPPLGLNLFVAARLTKTSVNTVINKHLGILILIALAVVFLITFFPNIILWLPNLMSK